MIVLYVLMSILIVCAISAIIFPQFFEFNFELALNYIGIVILSEFKHDSISILFGISPICFEFKIKFPRFLSDYFYKIQQFKNAHS